MTLIVCVIDYAQRRHYYNRPKIVPDSVGEGRQAVKGQLLRRLCLQLDAVSGNYLLREVLQQKVLSECLQNKQQVQLLWLTLQPPKRLEIDYKSTQLSTQTLRAHVQLESLMCWLSTLGGGYSALGDQFEDFAKTAGEISLQQLAIGLRLGNTLLQARCKLYYSISLIQRGQLRLAKKLIRGQHRVACDKQDQKLLSMCGGIWQRLCYEYELRQRKGIVGNTTNELNL